MSFAQKLKELLTQNNMSNYRLAQLIGVSQSSVANWLNGKTEPNSKKINEIAEVFGVTADYLLGQVSQNANAAINTLYNEIAEDYNKLTDEQKKNVKLYIELLKSQNE